MSDIYLGFTCRENPIAWGLYNGLLKEGVLPEEMDMGYMVANYNGLQCAGPGDRTCPVGLMNGRLEAEEVIEFALNNYKSYQMLIEEVLGRPLPWVFDDLNPRTDFDATVRERADAFISLSNNFAGNNRAHKLLLLYMFTSFPKEKLSQMMDSIIAENENNPKFDREGAEGVQALLEKNSSFKLRYDEAGPENTALGALELGAGDCSEQSNVFLPLLDRAWFSPFYVFVDFSRENVPSIEAYIPENSQAGFLFFTRA